MDKLESAIIKTLAYADLFDHALTTEELAKYLIQHKLKDVKTLSTITSPKFSHQDNIWTLSKREELINRKKVLRQTTKDKQQTTKKSLWIFNLVPWIKMVAITGSIAGGTPRPNDDIDLLIITDSRRLWLTRITVTFLLNLAGKRRKPTDDPDNVNNKFCLNMWLSTQSLEEESHDIYTANELANIIPLINRQNTYEHYIQSNVWVKEFLPNFYNKLNKHNTDTALPQSSRFNPLTILDSTAEKLQKKIMRQPTNETIQDSRLAFHPHDYRSEILHKYQQKLTELGIK